MKSIRMYSPTATDLLAAVLFFASALAFAHGAWLILAEPHLLNYTEGIGLFFAERIYSGAALYPDINTEPFIYNTYPWVYPMVAGSFVLLLGKSLFAIRLVSLICELMILAVVYFWLSRRRVTSPVSSEVTGDVRFALIFTAWLALIFATHKFHVLARVDFLQITFNLLGVFSLTRFLEAERRGWLIAFVLFSLLGVATKVTGIIVVGGCGFYGLLLCRDPEQRPVGLRVAAAAITVGLGSLFYLGLSSLFTDGQFYRHTVEFQGLSGYQWNSWIFIKFGRKYWPVLLLAFFALWRGRENTLLKILFLFTIGWLCFAANKQGADLNYTIEPLVYAVLLIGAFWRDDVVAPADDKGARWFGRRLDPILVTLLMMLTTVAGSLLTTQQRYRGYHMSATLEPPRARERRLVNKIVQRASGPVLLEEPFFAVLHDRQVYLSDPFQLVVLEKRGQFDSAPLMEMLAAGEFEVVVMGHRLYNLPGLYQILQLRYRAVLVAENWTHSGLPWIVFVREAGERDSPQHFFTIEYPLH